ncbi:7 transmembrane sweet-taste receptor of 3 GCPR-domain-containing protein [Polychytrium aggregatum]|uniref:7 transmembrane sweet-taste receptor of 3 GCPR-domain-containing protein n=1 Tax=Polychytrium aggregatum TaxID=110093 RepID=UPI0022FE65DB|nr:7 transmembrane sweet-taste receptor of 3 GCPR-domain-containing protein [Polychytrium aggregatum]KAI9206741.1 7 transmembrane sweet-taste receptor of 3 GCPR-domain-containing protein [Polychytrium aggregatum]
MPSELFRFVAAIWLLESFCITGIQAAAFTDCSPTNSHVNFSSSDAGLTIAQGSSLTLSNCVFYNSPLILVLGQLNLWNVTFVSQPLTVNPNTPAVTPVSITRDVYGAQLIRITGGTVNANTLILDGAFSTNYTLLKVESSGTLNITNLSFQISNPVPTRLDARLYGSLVVAIQSSHVSITNAVVSGEVTAALSGGIISLDTSASIAVTNATFSSIITKNNGGVFFATGSASATLTNTSFRNISAGQWGGGICASSRTSWVLNNVAFSDMSAGTHGGSMFFVNAAQAQWNGGSCIRSSSGNQGGCGYFENLVSQTSALSTFNGVTIDTVSSPNGGAFSLNGYITMQLTSVTLNNAFAATQGGAFYEWGPGPVIQVNNSVIQNILTAGFGGLAVSEHASALYLTNVIARNISSVAEGGLVKMIDSSIGVSGMVGDQIYAGTYGGIFELDRTDPSAVYNTQLTLTSSVFTNAGARQGNGGAIFLSVGTAATVENCSFTGTQATQGGFAYVSAQTSSQYTPASLAMLNSNSISNSVSTSTGGVFWVAGPSSLSFTSQSQPLIVSHSGTPSACGGFLYTSTNPTITFGQNIVMTQMSAMQGSSLCFSDYTSVVLVPNSATLSMVPSGDMYISNTTCANQLSSMQGWSAFLGSSVEPRGPPVTLRLLSGAGCWQPPPGGMQINQNIGPIQVQAVDAFGNPTDVNLQSPVVVTIQEVKMNVSINGESIKGIFNETSKAVAFSSITVNGLMGNYTLRVSALSGLAPTNTAAAWPTIDFEILPCSVKGMMWSSASNACLPTVATAPALKIIMAVLGAILLLCAVASAVLVLWFRDMALIRNSSSVFMCLIAIGTAMGFTAVLVKSFTFPLSCVISEWFEVIGFSAVLVALIVRTYRIHAIFSATKTLKLVTIKDSELGIYFIGWMLVVVIFLSVWTAIDPPEYTVLQTVGFFVVDHCDSTSTLSQVKFVLHLLCEVVAVGLAYMIRNVHTAFNESKLMAFACYNWVVFGALLMCLGSLLTDPNISFAIECISILVPHLITDGILIIPKLAVCVLHPDVAREPPKINPDLESASLNSKLQSTKVNLKSGAI